MTIFLYGSDDYRREEKKKWYITEFKKKYSGLNAEFFDLDPGTAKTAGTSGDEGGDALADLKNFLRAQSIFEAKKLIVIENLYEADEKAVKNALRDFVAGKDAVVLCSERNRPPTALKFLLAKPSIVHEFNHLGGAEQKNFIIAEAKKLRFQLEDGAVKLLAGVYSGNSWGLATELQKLANLGKKVVALKDLENLDLEIVPEFWATLGGLRSGNIASRLNSLEKIFALNEQPAKIFNILASMWREKVPQFAEYDLKIKSGKLDYEEALVDLATS